MLLRGDEWETKGCEGECSRRFGQGRDGIGWGNSGPQSVRFLAVDRGAEKGSLAMFVFAILTLEWFYDTWLYMSCTFGVLID